MHCRRIKSYRDFDVSSGYTIRAQIFYTATVETVNPIAKPCLSLWFYCSDFVCNWFRVNRKLSAMLFTSLDSDIVAAWIQAVCIGNYFERFCNVNRSVCRLWDIHCKIQTKYIAIFTDKSLWIVLSIVIVVVFVVVVFVVVVNINFIVVIVHDLQTKINTLWCTIWLMANC